MSVTPNYFSCNECPLYIDFECGTQYDKGETEEQYGHCEGETDFCPLGWRGAVVISTKRPKRRGLRKTGRAFRRYQKQIKYKRLKQIAGWRQSRCLAYTAQEYNEETDEWVDLKYMRYPKSSDRQQFFKQYSNKKVRKSKIIFQGNLYRRCFDYQWELF